MNWIAGAIVGAFSFVFMMLMTTFIMDKSVTDAVMYAVLAAAMLGPIFAYVARDIIVTVAGATPRKAADIIAAKFKIKVVEQDNGALSMTTGVNFFWREVKASPTPTGVMLSGPANIVSFMKKSLEKR